jgi:hypothetical protein
MPRHDPGLIDSPEVSPPDAGLAAISAGFAAGLGTGRRAPGHDQDHERPRRPGPADIWPLRLPVGFLAAAGTLDPVDWGPPTGRVWDINAVVITFGAGTTLVQVYDEAAQPANLLFQTGASGVWHPEDPTFLHGERLVVVATGGGVTVRIKGTQQSADYEPTHLT